MSRHPYRRKPPQSPAFRLTLWTRPSNLGASERRRRWAASLAVLGIRTFERQMNGKVALFREGVEEVAESTSRMREGRATVTNGKTTPYPTGPPTDRAS